MEAGCCNCWGEDGGGGRELEVGKWDGLNRTIDRRGLGALFIPYGWVWGGSGGDGRGGRERGICEFEMFSGISVWLSYLAETQ